MKYKGYKILQEESWIRNFIMPLFKWSHVVSWFIYMRIRYWGWLVSEHLSPTYERNYWKEILIKFQIERINSPDYDLLLVICYVIKNSKRLYKNRHCTQVSQQTLKGSSVQRWPIPTQERMEICDSSVDNGQIERTFVCLWVPDMCSQEK